MSQWAQPYVPPLLSSHPCDAVLDQHPGARRGPPQDRPVRPYGTPFNQRLPEGPAIPRARSASTTTYTSSFRGVQSVQEEAAQNSAWGSSNSTDGPPQIWDRFNEPELDILEYQKFDGDRRHIPSFGHNTQFNVGRQWGARIHSEAVLHADTTAVNFCVGITVQNSGDRRVLVTNVEPDSEAAFRGLRAGDLIFSVENVPIRTSAQLRDVMIHDPSNPLVFGVERDGRITNIPINNSPCVS